MKMASSHEEGQILYQTVPTSVSVQSMSDDDVSLWTKKLIGSFGGCITVDSRRNLLRKYLQKQEAGAANEHLPLSASVDNMSHEDVSSLLISQIGSFAECKDESSQKKLLKTYLQTKELMWEGGSRYETHPTTEYLLDDEVENGSYFLYEASQTNLKDGLSPKVDKMTYIEVANLLQKLEIPATNNLESDKLILNQHLFGKRRIHSLSQEVNDKLNEAVQMYKDFKTALLERCCDLTYVVQNESFVKEISEPTNQFFPGYETELKSTRTLLEKITDEFEIVVIGETSAGKSTFLNVLLGVDMLASHHLHETKCLYRLHNSDDRRIEYIVGQKHVCKYMKNDSSNIKETLESITQELMSNKEDDKSLKIIDVYWPVPSLHKNVVLIDTPGIGNDDTVALTKQVIEYIPNAAGYIFIVDSSHAGGIQDGAVRQLLEAIATSALKEESTKRFRNTFFVCNKWDLVPEQNRDDVLKNTTQKLRKYCGHLEDWQIVKFKAAVELKLLEMKADHTDIFDVLLKSLEKLMDRSIKVRLGIMYRWIRTFSVEVNGLINVRMAAKSQTKEDVLAKLKKADKELELLTKQLEQHTEISKLIDIKEEELLLELQKHLESDDTKSKLMDWTTNPPKLNEVDEVGPRLIKQRLQDVILDWAIAENGPLQTATKTILERYKTMQAETELRFKAIRDLKLGFILEDSTVHHESLSALEIITIVVTSPIWIPVGVVVFALGIVPISIWSIYRFVRSKELSIDAMKKITERTIRKFFKQKDHMQTFITDCFTRPQKVLVTNFFEKTKCKMKATQDMMRLLQNNFCLTSDTIYQLELLQTKLSKCSKCLQELEVNI